MLYDKIYLLTINFNIYLTVYWAKNYAYQMNEIFY